jgi:enamine deaminase RidA (YjgF/YER057c/UK114 family)
MPSQTPEIPICFRMNPDRQLLDGKCELHDCASLHGLPGEPAPRFATHDSPPCLLGKQHHTSLGYDGLKRLVVMVTPEPVGSFQDQTWEAVSTIRAILRQQNEPMAVTVQTVFLKDAANAPAARALFEAYYGDRVPLTSFVIQPPCDGSALAIEAWAVGSRTAKVEYLNRNLVTVSYDGVRWIHAGAGSLQQYERSAYEQATDAFEGMAGMLAEAGASFQDVVRTWLYQGGITELEGDTERYRELNRARTDFFNKVLREMPLASRQNGAPIYPASTGIGTLNRGLVTSLLAVQSERKDVQFTSLENPLQTAAFDYPQEYSLKSPKFSRATALRMGNHVTTWVSGTASIVDALTVHVGDIEKQTDQTLTNIERLIDAANFANLGWKDSGATLGDLAKLRVYVKRIEDYEKCRATCERRVGKTPTIYTIADVCRPDLLVEIEGVAFSPLHKSVVKSERSQESCVLSESFR